MASENYPFFNEYLKDSLRIASVKIKDRIEIIEEISTIDLQSELLSKSYAK